MTQLTARLEELKKLCESATEGPWEWVGSDLWGKNNDEVLNFKCRTFFGLSGASPILESTDENRAFIAQSRELVPKLIEALEVVIGQRNRIAKKPIGDYMGDEVIKACDNAIISILCEQGESEGNDEETKRA